MTGIEVAPGVHRLGTDWINWYLVEEGGKLTVVDTGIGGYHDQLEPALRRIGRRLDDIEAVVITHYHDDHLGCAERIRAAAGARVLAPEGDDAAIRGDAKAPPAGGFIPNLWRPVMVRFMAHALTNGGAGSDPVRELETYGDGETLEIPGRPRTIATPGHTPGHHALLFPGHGVLYAGDAMATVSWTSGSTEPQLHPFGEDRDRMRASLAALEPVEAEVLTFGHGDPFRGSPAEAVARARELDG